MNWKRQLRALNWDAVGGFIAAFLAVILHLLRFIDEAVLLAIMTSLLALLFFRDLREETAEEELTESVTNTEQRVAEIRAALTPPELELIGPDSLRRVSQHFGREAHGEVVWFNLCLLMFTRRERSIY